MEGSVSCRSCRNPVAVFLLPLHLQCLLCLRHINELGQSPERVDPHLGNNHVLVSHLCRLEETWQRAQKYLRDTQRLRDLLSLVEFISEMVMTEKSIQFRSASQQDTRSTEAQAPGTYSKGMQQRLRPSQRNSSGGALPSRHSFGLASRTRGQQQDSRVPTSSSTESDAAETLEHRVVNCDVGAFLAVSTAGSFYGLGSRV